MKDINDIKPPQDMLDSARKGADKKAAAETVERVRSYVERHLCAKQFEVAAALNLSDRTVLRCFNEIRRGFKYVPDPNSKFTTVTIDLPKSGTPEEYVLALQAAQTTMHLEGNDSGYKSLGNLVMMVSRGMESPPPPLQRTLTVVAKIVKSPFS